MITSSSSLLLLLFLMLLRARARDFDCLREFKQSVQDPQGYLNGWIFDSTSEMCSFAGVTCTHRSGSVHSLSLPGAGLMGSFPSGFGKCISLTSLNLSNNSFTGPVPENLCGILRFLVTFDMSQNRISSSLSARFADCTYLKNLDLSHNKLTGNIPREIGLLPRLKTLNVSYNDLSGTIPYNLQRFPASSFQDNPKLCRAPAAPYSLLRSFLKAGPVIALVVIFLLGLVLVLAWKRTNSFSNLEEYHPKFLPSRYLRLDERDFLSLTSNFVEDLIIGKGGSSTVYKGALATGQNVAVKRLRIDRDTMALTRKSFIRELEILGKLRHRNLVRILGYFSNLETMALILEYMPNGSLEGLLHSEVKRFPLDWDKRYRIALGVAQGICYLHHECGEPIVHCDIKPSNILLAEDLHARISDFGVASMYSRKSSCVMMWSIGYTAPEVAQGARPSPKLDVYSFGILLLELLTRECPCSSRFLSTSLRQWVQSAMQRGEGHGIMDMELQPAVQLLPEMLSVMNLALSCTHPCPARRPDMVSVLRRLIFLRDQNFQERFDKTIDVLADEPTAWDEDAQPGQVSSSTSS